MLKLKTHFIPRTLNFVNPKICIYDLDGTIINSSHRTRYLDNGDLDLEHWKANCTKDQIMRDDLLPMYWQLRADYENGNIVVICTARELSEWDYEYLSFMGIYYDYIYSRPKENMTKDDILKKAQLRHFWNFKQYSKFRKLFADDRIDNLNAIRELGNVDCINAKVWNRKFA
tara:strand:- start:589 stop:1104 length:516 start_codon:yes stop_codon:yes gene_type:complete